MHHGGSSIKREREGVVGAVRVVAEKEGRWKREDGGREEGRCIRDASVYHYPGVPNPINVALKLLEQSSQGCLPLGRVPPM